MLLQQDSYLQALVRAVQQADPGLQYPATIILARLITNDPSTHYIVAQVSLALSRAESAGSCSVLHMLRRAQQAVQCAVVCCMPGLLNGHMSAACSAHTEAGIPSSVSMKLRCITYL